MKVKDLIVKIIGKESVNYIFMVPGGLVDPFLTAFDGQTQVTPIVAAQEGGAAYMADGYSRASNRFGVCLCIGGPGTTNTVTPLLAAKSDYSPILILSGEVPTCKEGIGMFQDASLSGLDDFDILKPATKSSTIIENPKLFFHHFQKSLQTMLSRNKSPVHISIPRDIQNKEMESSELPILDKSFYYTSILDQAAAAACIKDLQNTKVAILIGNGLSSPDASQALIKFSESTNIPIATTLRAKGAFPENHPLSLGVFGYAGTNHSTQALLHENLEVLLVIGSGLNQRDSMNWTKELNPSKKFIQVNIDLNTSSTLHPNNHLIEGDAETFIKFLLTQNVPSSPARNAWVQEIKKRPRFYDAQNLVSESIPIHPARAVHDLRQAAPQNTILLVDSGAHRAFCGHYWESYHPGEYISATNLGPMGWAIPAAVGVKLAQPGKPCCVVTGDGCMLMHGMEIQTAARYKIPIVYVVINNSALGNVYLRAQNEGAIATELTTLPDHDWAGFAKALGAQGETVTDPKNLIDAFRKAFASNTTYLIDVKCDKHCPTPVEPFAEVNKTWSYHD